VGKGVVLLAEITKEEDGMSPSIPICRFRNRGGRKGKNFGRGGRFLLLKYRWRKREKEEGVLPHYSLQVRGGVTFLYREKRGEGRERRVLQTWHEEVRPLSFL